MGERIKFFHPSTCIYVYMYVYVWMCVVCVQVYWNFVPSIKYVCMYISKACLGVLASSIHQLCLSVCMHISKMLGACLLKCSSHSCMNIICLSVYMYTRTFAFVYIMLLESTFCFTHSVCM